MRQSTELFLYCHVENFFTGLMQRTSTLRKQHSWKRQLHVIKTFYDSLSYIL